MKNVYTSLIKLLFLLLLTSISSMSFKLVWVSTCTKSFFSIKPLCERKKFLQIVIQNITSLFKIYLYPYLYQNMYIFFYHIMQMWQIVYYLINDKNVSQKINYKDIKDNFLIKHN